MTVRWIRCRVPETGAHISVPESALPHFPGLVRLDRPPADAPAPSKTKKSLKAAGAAESSKE